MSDLISRQAAIEAIEEYIDRLQLVDWKENPGVPYKAHALNWAINTIRDLPSAEPERKNGKYLKTGDPKWIECSECGMHTRYLKKYNVPNFCPACGAYMKGTEDD